MTIDPGRPVQTWSIHLGEDESRVLLRDAPIGRLGVIVHGRPEIFPVAHVYVPPSGGVIFPSRPGTKLEAAFDWPWVAFEVDGLDPDGETAWSVLVVGHAEELSDPVEIAHARDTRRVAWSAGRDVRWIRIVPAKVTGLRISAVR